MARVNWYHAYERIHASFTGKKPRRKRFNFEIHITDSCNLNCKGCAHFAPLAKPNADYPLEEFKRDIQRIAELFGGRFGWIHLMGGEPLLNPRINEYLDIVGTYIHDGQIDLVTNGLLLPKMDEKFYACCERNRIRIAVTRYPVQLDYEALEKTARSHGVAFALFGDRTGDKGFGHPSLCEEPKFSYKKAFFDCELSYACVTLNHGRLYPCSASAYAYLYQDYFRVEGFNGFDDSISIYENDARAIVDFLRSPHPFCAHCDIKSRRRRAIPWGPSARKKEEWVIIDEKDRDSR